MSMYTDLLGRALDSNTSDLEQTGGELLATLLRCRSQLLASHSTLTEAERLSHRSGRPIGL